MGMHINFILLVIRIIVARHKIKSEATDTDQLVALIVAKVTIELMHRACLVLFTPSNSRIITSVGHFECINSDTHQQYILKPITPFLE